MKKKIHIILAVMIFMCMNVGCGSSQPAQTAKQEKTTSNNSKISHEKNTQSSTSDENAKSDNKAQVSAPNIDENTKSVDASKTAEASSAENIKSTDTAETPTNATTENTKPADTSKASATTLTTDAKTSETVKESPAATPSEPGKYEQISQDKAKALMDAEEPAVILDVRTIEEFNQGHIDGALCIPVESINDQGKAMIEQIIPRKDQIILVYCRSGNRSKTASQALANMGYTNVKEFGGINDWKYGTVTE